MSYTRLNSSAATLTKNRTEDAVVPISGMCATCVDGCIGMCEIGKSAYRGAEMIYPQPFGIITTAGQKDYPVDLSHFTILGRCAGAWGMDQDSNRALFPAVDLEVALGSDNGIRYKLPFTLGAMGSTNVAKNNWPGLAAGAAITGTGIAIGENVVGMDMESRFENGKVISSVDLEWRVKCFRDWQTDGYGEVYVQANVEDTLLGVQEYAIKNLGVKAVELKWGQGAKDIGGEVKIKDLNKAQELQRRGYVVLPDPSNAIVIEAFKKGSFHEFERHSRVGMVSRDGFLRRVEELRKCGAKYITLKTGAYRPADLARAVKYASLAEIDLLTVDAAGGGTGMARLSVGVAQQRRVHPGHRAGRRLHLRGPDVQGFCPLCAVRQADCYGSRPAGRGHGSQDHRQGDRSAEPANLHRALRYYGGRDLRYRTRATPEVG